jgi:16S rRNA (guanine527-N7)-methyltransferase
MFHVEHERDVPNWKGAWERDFDRIGGWLDKTVRDYPEGCLPSLRHYCRLLYDASWKINLVSPNDRTDLAIRHVLPSLEMAMMLKIVSSRVVLDFGSGAGIPGIPMKLLLPEKQFILVESRRKRANFLKDVVRQLGLTGIEVANQRIEDMRCTLKEGVDVVVTRAVVNLQGLMSLVDSVLKPYGMVITTLAPSRGYRQGVAVLCRSRGEVMGQTYCFGLLR